MTLSRPDFVKGEGEVKLHSWDEWTTLREVVVGTAEGLARYHLDSSFRAFFRDNLKPFLGSESFRTHVETSGIDPIIDIEEWILDELREDLAGLVDALERCGIVVRRAAAMPLGPIKSPWWETIAYPALNVRDNCLILGDTIIETSPHVRGRLFENFALRNIFVQKLGLGARWLCMPTPSLAGDMENPVIFGDAGGAEHIADSGFAGNANSAEMLFDGAQCLRFGKDVVVNLSSQSHELASAWLVRMMGDRFRFHLVRNLADGHVDSTVLPLRPGILLVRDASVRGRLPEWLQSWKTIVAPVPRSDQFPSYENTSLAIASNFIDMNVLSISEETVIVNSLYPELAQVLEQNGFNVIAVRHRHRRLVGGGFHCFTLDLARDGACEDYQ